MGEAGSAELLVAVPDLVPDLKGDDRAPVVLEQQDLEAVRERGRDDLLRRVDRPRRRGGKDEGDDQSARNSPAQGCPARFRGIAGYPPKVGPAVARSGAAPRDPPSP